MNEGFFTFSVWIFRFCTCVFWEKLRITGQLFQSYRTCELQKWWDHVHIFRFLQVTRRSPKKIPIQISNGGGWYQLVPKAQIDWAVLCGSQQDIDDDLTLTHVRLNEGRGDLLQYTVFFIHENRGSRDRFSSSYILYSTKVRKGNRRPTYCSWGQGRKRGTSQPIWTGHSFRDQKVENFEIWFILSLG